MGNSGQWGNTVNGANSVLWGASETTKLKANSQAIQSAFYNNTTIGAYINNLAVGEWGVSVTEQNVSYGPLVEVMPATYGSGYLANTANVTISSNSATQTGQNAAAYGVANSSGKIASYYVASGGNTYNFIPTITVPAPAATSFNANTAVDGSNDTIAVTSAGVFRAFDQIKYYTAGGNTVIGGLANNTTYYVNFANSTVVALSNVPSNLSQDRIALVPSTISETGHFLQGITATGKATIGGANRGNGAVVTHSGWVLRKSGTGGRAGRVQYETLVAMGSLGGSANGAISNNVFLPG